jgi:streptomycin 6-kinase
VLAATRVDGTPALLKVPAVDDENRMEGAALRRYGGDGAALLYAVDEASGALLMERLEPGTPLGDHPDRDVAVGIASRLLRRLSRPVTGGHHFPLVSDLLAGWAGAFPAAQERTGALAAAEFRAVTAALEALSAPAGRPVLVNRDGHMDNVLAAEREPWLLIDPKPLAGEAAFDGGWLLIDAIRTSPTRAAVERYAARVGEGLAVPPERVRAWALLRAADNLFWELGAGDDPAMSRAQVAALS